MKIRYKIISSFSVILILIIGTGVYFHHINNRILNNIEQLNSSTLNEHKYSIEMRYAVENSQQAAMELKNRLEAILAGEPPYDIFVRWKPLHQQPIGWEPDINDGVCGIPKHYEENTGEDQGNQIPSFVDRPDKDSDADKYRDN